MEIFVVQIINLHMHKGPIDESRLDIPSNLTFYY